MLLLLTKFGYGEMNVLIFSFHFLDGNAGIADDDGNGGSSDGGGGGAVNNMLDILFLLVLPWENINADWVCNVGVFDTLFTVDAIGVIWSGNKDDDKVVLAAGSDVEDEAAKVDIFVNWFVLLLMSILLSLLL